MSLTRIVDTATNKIWRELQTFTEEAISNTDFDKLIEKMQTLINQFPRKLEWDFLSQEWDDFDMRTLDDQFLGSRVVESKTLEATELYLIDLMQKKMDDIDRIKNKNSNNQEQKFNIAFLKASLFIQTAQYDSAFAIYRKIREKDPRCWQAYTKQIDITVTYSRCLRHFQESDQLITHLLDPKNKIPLNIRDYADSKSQTIRFMCYFGESIHAKRQEIQIEEQKKQKQMQIAEQQRRMDEQALKRKQEKERLKQRQIQLKKREELQKIEDKKNIQKHPAYNPFSPLFSAASHTKKQAEQLSEEHAVAQKKLTNRERQLERERRKTIQKHPTYNSFSLLSLDTPNISSINNPNQLFSKISNKKIPAVVTSDKLVTPSRGNKI